MHPDLDALLASSAVRAAPRLLGWHIACGRVSGVITETEAYHTVRDRACHASRGRTPRTEILFARHGTDELVARLHEADAPVGKVNLKPEVIDDPQVVHNRALVEIDHGDIGRVRVARAAARFGETDAPVPGPAPHLGEHGRQVLEQLGYDPERIAALQAAGAVRLP